MSGPSARPWTQERHAEARALRQAFRDERDADRAYMMAARAVNGDLPAALDEIERLRDLLFARGAMRTAPCFACGYNGPGYFQPSTHACATRHHALYQPEPGPGVEAVLELHRSGR